MKSILAAAAALSFGSSAYAASISQQCPSEICFSLNIPESTASSGNGDIYFQISAPTSYEWVGLGQGTQMSGSNMFVMYTSSDGSNVTVSPRLGTGHSEPQHDTSARITLLEGSGVSGGKMTANVRCSNCASWSGGSMDFTSSSASWIYAAKSGTPIESDSLSESISQHSENSPFTWPISSAKGGNDVNPFVSSSSGTSGDGTTTSSGSAAATGASSSSGIPSTCTPIADSSPTSGAASTTRHHRRPTARPSDYPSGPPNSRPTGPPRAMKRDDGCPAGYASTSSGTDNSAFQNNGAGFSLSQHQGMLLAHGVLACIAFVGLFPIGGILIRLGNFTGLVWVHAALQCFAYFIYIVAFGMGVYMATQLKLMTNAHPIIGIALFVILLGQPLLGFLHHRRFKKVGHRTFWSYAHLFHGRVAILLGMVNGGLGIQLAGTASMGAKIAYAVVAAIMGFAYVSAIIVGELRRRRPGAPPSYENSQNGMRLESRDASSSGNSRNEEFYAKRQERI